MTDKFKPGDKVKWESSGHEIAGTVKKKATTETRIKGHVAKPTKEEPQFVVKSDKTGKEAVHKPEDLKKA